MKRFMFCHIVSFGYRRLQVFQSKCLRVIGNLPRRTPITQLHANLHIIPISQLVYHLTLTFFSRCPDNPNPLIRSIGQYSHEYLHQQYSKYRHNRTKHINTHTHTHTWEGMGNNSSKFPVCVCYWFVESIKIPSPVRSCCEFTAL
jgi:hypothetical protein